MSACYIVGLIPRIGEMVHYYESDEQVTPYPAVVTYAGDSGVNLHVFGCYPELRMYVDYADAPTGKRDQRRWCYMPPLVHDAEVTGG